MIENEDLFLLLLWILFVHILEMFFHIPNDHQVIEKILVHVPNPFTRTKRDSLPN